ncbi:hypothetical protein V9T40_011464 [Parthenolecanium corni]|uniref:Uncharacterized protein n=1 Tax=Parthenolecanium corni TaxID=536013 RepID=A0AAN9XZI8_9HEMI
MTTGTINSENKVVAGVKPIAIKPAYVIDPKNPAPPVPDDHPLRTDLEPQIIINCKYHTDLPTTYLSSKKTVYEIKDDSPNPLANDVHATPMTVIVRE